MQFKKKLAYMALGGLLVFMGQLLSSIIMLQSLEGLGHKFVRMFSMRKRA